MMLRRVKDCGFVDLGWLQSRHVFSFADYYDPRYMGFANLRVINHDIIQADKGFAPHSHQNMEIITYIIQGAVSHQDNMGNETIIRAGEIQLMSAGKGVTHSEFNRATKEPLELLQIWILPNQKNTKPSYQQMVINKSDQPLTLLISADGRNQSLKILQTAQLWLGNLHKDQHYTHEMNVSNQAWIQVIHGALTCNDITLNQGDGCGFSDTSLLTLLGKSQCEFLLFDL